jgi:cytochrome c oxidase subunit 4
MSHDAHAAEEPHIVPLSVYLTIFALLMIFTVLTVWVAVLDLGAYGWLHTPLALAIATVKATLVVLWFMHVKYGSRLVWVFVGAGLAWLALLVGITVGDYVGRSWEPDPNAWRASVEIVAPHHLG